MYIPTKDSPLDEQYRYALSEGPIIVSVPGERLHGFVDLDASLLYCEMVAAKNGQPPIKKVLLVTGKKEIEL